MTKQTSANPAAQRKRVRLVDLAEHLGMPKGTVSRALNGYPDISETTRTRVRRAAESIGYRPLSNAQAIRTGRVKSLGLILQISEHDGQRPFVADFLAGVSRAASDADWTVTVATAASGEEYIALLEKLWMDRKADGFILPRTQVEDARIAYLKRRAIPFVLYGRTRDLSDCAWFDLDGRAAIRDATLQLARLGHSRIGFVPGAAEFMYASIRQEGYVEALEQAGFPFDPALITAPGLLREQGAARVRALLDLSAPPTALVCAVDQAALGAYDAAREAGLRIGQDLSVISYDGIPEGALLDPPLTTYSADARHAGGRLADLLIRRINGEAAEDLQELARARFVSRGSHGAPRQDVATLRHTIDQNQSKPGGPP